MNEDSKKKILARRAQFVAAAFVGITGCSSETTGIQANPEPCLSQAIEDTGRADTRDADSADTAPMPCLTVDAESSDTSDTSDASSDTGVADTFPMPCLVPPLDSGE